MLNACGKMNKGYLGVAICLNDEGAFSEVKDVLSSYRKEIARSLNWIHKNRPVREEEFGNYIVAGKNIPESVISNVVSIISHSGTLPPKPLFAFVETEEGMIKISARADDSLVSKGLNLKEIITRIVKEIGGEGGGHAGAAGAFISKENVETFIKSAEKLLKRTMAMEVGRSETRVSAQNNINNVREERIVDSNHIPAQGGHTKTESSEEYGTAESKGSRGEAEGEAEAKRGRGKKDEKMEGKGLVRYFGP